MKIFHNLSLGLKGIGFSLSKTTLTPIELHYPIIYLQIDSKGYYFKSISISYLTFAIS